MSVGLELMLEGINMYEQTHQVVHPEVASAYNNYAVTMNQLVRLRTSQLAAEGKEDADPSAGLDVATAIKLQRQAVMTAERTLGLHHSETIVYYFNLAMLEVVSGDQTIALRLFKHVLHLWDVVYGQEHPELTAILVSRGADVARSLKGMFHCAYLNSHYLRFTSLSYFKIRTDMRSLSSCSKRFTVSPPPCSARRT